MATREHWVIDAHGRSLDLTSDGQAPPASADLNIRRRREWLSVVVGVTAVLVGGVVGIVLINAIHDIAVTVAGTGVAGVLLKALLAPFHRRER
ncbi:hypothetical protein [Streptomyces rubiginosohelvolus]